MKAAPGDPVRYILNIDDVAISDEQIEELRDELGFNKPIYIQYWNWLIRFFQFDLGYSYMTSQPVLDELARKIPCHSYINYYITYSNDADCGSYWDTCCLIQKNKWIDHVSRVIALIGASVPSFWLGLLFFIQFFSR
ncbi:hypothetical protein GCM10020331_085910 [Ectobacillus funiculus]